MPRAKVRPEDRRRSVRACDSCKASKIRCDSRSPCFSCVRRGCSASCAYSSGTIAAAQRSAAHKPGPRPALSLPQSEHDPSARTRFDDEDRPVPSPSHTGRPSDASAQPQGRILLSSKGEKVYLGPLGPHSFLQFLRQTLRQHMGPSAFTDNQASDMMLEADMAEARGRNILAGAEMEFKQSLVHFFFQATSGVVDLDSPSDVYSFLHICDPKSHEPGHPEKLARLYLILAIGGQSRNAGPEDLQFAAACFVRAQRAAFDGMLSDPSIDMVCLFLLMAFYMLGACRRNTAFMYLGVASRAACALGLHLEECNKILSPEEFAARSHTWKSLRILDLATSSILGRPPASSFSKASPPTGLETFNDPSVATVGPALSAAFDACAVVDDFMQSLGEVGTVDMDTAEGYLLRLRLWSQQLPNGLRLSVLQPALPVDDARRPAMLGALHVSCLYYFSVIMVTRPFLITHLTQHLPGGNMAAPDGKVFDLANVCIEAATCMAKFCTQAAESGLLLKNMCLLKAWLFSAGLILGFSIFTVEVSSTETQEAFDGIQSVLLRFAESSPQAAHYCEILQSFSEAIKMHRRAVSDQRKRSAHRYMGEIAPVSLSDGLVVKDDQSSLGAVSTSDAIADDVNLADLALSWDDFSFEYDPFGSLFEQI